MLTYEIKNETFLLISVFYKSITISVLMLFYTYWCLIGAKIHQQNFEKKKIKTLF